MSSQLIDSLSPSDNLFKKFLKFLKKVHFIFKSFHQMNKYKKDLKAISQVPEPISQMYFIILTFFFFNWIQKIRKQKKENVLYNINVKNVYIAKLTCECFLFFKLFSVSFETHFFDILNLICLYQSIIK